MNLSDILRYNRRQKMIGARIAAERKALPKRTSQGALAEMVSNVLNMGVHITEAVGQSTISNWESGKVMPPIDKLCCLAEIFGCDVGYLLCDYDERTRDIADASTVTGLTGSAVKVLSQITHSKYAPLGATAKGYTVGMVSVLSDLIESKHFYGLIADLSFYLIYGGALPEDAYGTDNSPDDISVDEYDRIMEWTNTTGREIVLRSDVHDFYLQKACDVLKKIATEMLENALAEKSASDGQNSPSHNM